MLALRSSCRSSGASPRPPRSAWAGRAGFVTTVGFGVAVALSALQEGAPRTAENRQLSNAAEPAAAPLRPPLSRERILHAALRIADESGVETLTMRRLGEELGFEAMSLYRHVANKDDVLDGLIDLVLAETEPPTRAG